MDEGFPTMRRLATLLVVLLASGPSHAEVPPTRGGPPEPGRLDAILADWGERSARVTRLDAEFRRVDADHATHERAEFTGRLLMSAPHLAFLDIRRVLPDGRSASDERAVCDGREVAWYHPEVRRVLVVPFLADVDRDLGGLNVVRRDPKADLPAYVSTFLLAANVERHGPVPFLWSVRPESLRARYAIELLSEDPSSCRLRFRPRTELERSRLSEAVVELEKATSLPSSLRILSPEGTQTQDFTFTDLRVDAPIEPANFTIRPAAGWETVRPSMPKASGR